MKNNTPLVCICIPTFNSEKTISATLSSVLEQTYSNFVIKISDNDSTDKTLEVINSFQDPRIHVYTHDKNIGGEGNFNRCIELAEGKYTAIFHADDIYEPTMVEKQVAFLENNTTAGAVFTEAKLIDELDKVIGEIKLPKELKKNGVNPYDFKTIFKAVLKHSNFFICPSFMVKTQIYQKQIIGWRGELFKSSADLDVWLRILEKNKIGHIQEPLIRYRLSESQWSARIRKDTEEADFFLVIRHYLTKKSVRSFFDKQDAVNYRDLVRRDHFMRVINLFLLGREIEAEELLRCVISWEMLRRTYVSKRGMLVSAGTIYLKFILFFKLSSLGRATLQFIKTRFIK